MISQAPSIARSLQIEGTLIVAACGTSRGIGNDGVLPWPKLSADLKSFKELTMGSPILMGSSTYNSIPKSVRPLPGRLNIVLSSRTRAQLELPDSVLIAGSLDAAAALLEARGLRKVFVAGGESVYKQALERPEWSQRVHYTHIDAELPCDRFFPLDLRTSTSGFRLISLGAQHSECGLSFQQKEYVREGDAEGNTSGDDVSFFGVHQASGSARHAEYQYLDLVRHILRHGVLRGDRTGTGTRSVFGAQMRFDLSKSFPLLTTKRVFWRGVVEELLWFISGSTNANTLAAKGVHIWDGNGSRDFLDKLGFTKREVGDLGPVYGFQWRHFGSDYSNMRADYAGQGVDQLSHVIDTIKKNPNDRRILLCAWNPQALPLMALPPCHVLAQFYVAGGRLSCQMYQRSCDMGLGVPFNIASYALLTCLIAKVCKLELGEFVHTLGDAHVYNNHVDALEEQLQREPKAFPTVEIADRESIDDFCAADIVLKGYSPHKAITMKMAV